MTNINNFLKYIKKSYLNYWYLGYYKIAIVGFLSSLLINLFIFLLFTDLKNYILIIYIIFLEKQFILFIILYYMFFKEQLLNLLLGFLPFGIGEDKLHEQFNQINLIIYNFLQEYLIILIFTIIINRFILNFIAKNIYDYDI